MVKELTRWEEESGWEKKMGDLVNPQIGKFSKVCRIVDP